jgi:sugar lactone lactonase YvrE
MTAAAAVFDTRPCLLGEGPLWHPSLRRLFWFDIVEKRLLTQGPGGPHAWHFDRCVSAAGWIDDASLLIATETDLIRFDLGTGEARRLVAMEADNAATRSNDGRADPQGGFWIGTMGKHAEPGAGAIYRYFKGELRRLAGGITIPNAISFAPDGRSAYAADTATRTVWRIPLDTEGWPAGEWQVFLDHREAGLNPDGAVVDREGRFWCAEWGAGRVACYAPDGAFVQAFDLPAPQPSCPAFGGPDLRTLYVTTARQDMSLAALEAAPLSGQTFALDVPATGQAEHRVIL